MCFGVPAGGIIIQIKVKFRSPNLNDVYNNACYVYPDGDVVYGTVVNRDSCGRKIIFRSPGRNRDDVCYVYQNGDISVIGSVYWDSGG